MDLEAVRTFAAVADTGQFLAAADELGVTQQAVSKRIAALERRLGVSLFVRSARGVRLSVDGQAFLPHARELLRAADRAVASVRPGRRALRIDVLNRRTAPATALYAFHQRHPEIELDVIALPDASADSALAAVAAGTVDATFRAVTAPRRQLGPTLRAERLIDDPHQLLVGRRHPLADATQLTPADLKPYRIWMPGMKAGTEWSGYYEELARVFELTIDTTGPSFGAEVLLAELAGSTELATFAGEGTRYLWPERYDLRRIPIVDPAPVYPHSLVWRPDNPHPGLAAFIHHLRAAQASTTTRLRWAPPWASGV